MLSTATGVAPRGHVALHPAWIEASTFQLFRGREGGHHKHHVEIGRDELLAPFCADRASPEYRRALRDGSNSVRVDGVQRDPVPDRYRPRGRVDTLVGYGAVQTHAEHRALPPVYPADSPGHGIAVVGQQLLKRGALEAEPAQRSVANRVYGPIMT